ncbi:MAG TPA: ornithine cyclodeaminase family protein [bacterium]|nr:ornithine cyclodeaminase family protein [bacterium]
MALFLREADVAALVGMDDVIDVVERGFREHGAGRAVNRPRQRVAVEGGTLHVMAAGLPSWGVFGLKSYAVTRDGRRFVSLLYSAESGELLAMMEAEGLGRLRTGAASGVATRYLAKADAGTVGILGTGGQARTQLQAIARVRPVALVKAYSRTPARRETFADEMVQELGAEVIAADSPEEAVDGVDVIVTITSARDPVLRGAWLRPGMHINAAGSNASGRRELDEEAVGRAARVVVDARDQAMAEAGDLLAPIRAGRLSWEQVEELGAIVAGTAPGRQADEEITLFESQGIALEDVATMSLIYTRARETGRGEEIAR